MPRHRGALVDPRLHERTNRREIHSRERQIVTRRKTHHAAETALGIGDEQTTGCRGLGAGSWGRRPGGGGLGAGWPERGKIVVERECRRVLRIAAAVRARVPRTAVTP